MGERGRRPLRPVLRSRGLKLTTEGARSRARSDTFPDAKIDLVTLGYEKGDVVTSIAYSINQVTNGTRKTAGDQKDQLIALAKRGASK